MKLKTLEESSLVSWIISEDLAGTPPTDKEIKEMVKGYFQLVGRSTKLSKNRLARFGYRHPEIKKVSGRTIQSARYSALKSPKLSRFFDYLEQALKTFNTDGHNIHNMDETPFFPGDTGKVQMDTASSSSSSQSTAELKAPENCIHVTIIECIGAKGFHIDPFIIFPGSSSLEDFTPQNSEKVPKWLMVNKDKALLDSDVCLKWLNEVFIPQTTPSNPEEYRLLILDSHFIHLSKKFIFTSWKYKIALLYLPAHSTHLLQPLDVCCLGPLKKAYQDLVDDVLKTCDLDVENDVFLFYYNKAREKNIE